MIITVLRSSISSLLEGGFREPDEVKLVPLVKLSTDLISPLQYALYRGHVDWFFDLYRGQFQTQTMMLNIG